MAPVLSTHLLVLWLDDQKHSIVNRSKLVDLRLQSQPDCKLWKKTTLVVWKKTERFEATIIDTGEINFPFYQPWSFAN
jgi:hypothetical protein